MNKYSTRICACGVIHLLDKTHLDYLGADPSNRAVYSICGNCGRGKKIFLTERSDEGFDINSVDIDDSMMLDSEKEKFQLYLDRGIPVPMLSGRYADQYYAGQFWDQEGYYTSETNVYDDDAKKVDMDRFIKQVGDDDKLQAISSLVVRSFNWKGTKYEK